MEAGIERMPLYASARRIYGELRAAGKGEGPLSVEDLSPFDQLHYHGTEAVDLAIRALGINVESFVLEVGSGLGGPARHLAQRTGCHVTALELQPELHAVAANLTARCGLEDNLSHVCGDILSTPMPGGFDAVVSWLSFQHIADRARLLARCRALLVSGGKLYCEDFIARADPDAGARRTLAEVLYVRCLRRFDEYARDFEDAALAPLRMDDLSADWAAFCRARLEAFRAERERHVRVHGERVVADLDAFYGAVDALFATGLLGGVRLLAAKR